MDQKRFEQQLSFILEADKEKNILRQTHLSGHGRRENDAEHAWHMAMMIYLLKEYSNRPFDVAKAMMMALIHDVVEIDAGDTYAYDAKGLEAQHEREQKAAERIFGLLPDDQCEELMALFAEYEDDRKSKTDQSGGLGCRKCNSSEHRCHNAQRRDRIRKVPGRGCKNNVQDST